MPNQDMLFPILPRPTHPVNIHEIVQREREVSQVDKKTPTSKVEEEYTNLPQNQQQYPTPHQHQEEQEDTDQSVTSESTDHKDNDHPEHIDLFV